MNDSKRDGVELGLPEQKTASKSVWILLVTLILGSLLSISLIFYSFESQQNRHRDQFSKSATTP